MWWQFGKAWSGLGVWGYKHSTGLKLCPILCASGETLLSYTSTYHFVNQTKSKEIDLFWSNKHGFPSTTALCLLMAKALGYLFHYRTSCGLIKGIPLPSPNGSQMVNGHFVDNCFLIALEEQDKLVNTMDCIYIFNEFSHSKVQMAKMQCYHITQDNIRDQLSLQVGHGLNVGKFSSSWEFLLPFRPLLRCFGRLCCNACPKRSTSGLQTLFH